VVPLWNRIANGSLATPSFQFLVPLGISFYTFKAVGYLIDVYNGKYAAERIRAGWHSLYPFSRKSFRARSDGMTSWARS